LASTEILFLFFSEHHSIKAKLLLNFRLFVAMAITINKHDKTNRVSHSLSITLRINRIIILRKILIFGNSGAGKSTLAKNICATEGLAHLDLDTLAWQPILPPERKPLRESEAEISAFIKKNEAWVIEGCYADLLDIARPFSNEIIFMNLPIELCIENAKSRPWEPHKYESKVAQDSNLAMLIDWISQYTERKDTFSAFAHNKLYQQYTGKKSLITANE
jgi:adenylate kinase family enzyme